MKITEKLDDIYKKIIEIGYWSLPISSDVDYDIINCIKSYQDLSINKQASFRKSVTGESTRLLLYFSERMATLSLRTSNQNMFQVGLIALEIIAEELDVRDIHLIMSLYYDVAIRNNLSFEKVLNQNDGFSVFVKTFLDRKEEDKTLESMGYKLTNDNDNNPIYQRTW